MSAYLEVKAAKVKSWEEEQLMSLNKVVRDLQDEMQLAKQTEAGSKRKITKMLTKNKKSQEAVKRLTGEKESLAQENQILSAKIEKLEKEVAKALSSTINETKIEKVEESSSSSVDEDEEKEEKAAKEEKDETTEESPGDETTVKEEEEAENENNVALKMLDEIRIKMDKLTDENGELKKNLQVSSDKIDTYEEGMIMIKDCFGVDQCNKSFREETKNDFIKLFVQSIMDSVEDLKGKIAVCEEEKTSLQQLVHQGEEAISKSREEYENLLRELENTQTDFDEKSEEIKTQKSRIERALDQVQSDLNEAVLRNQNLENDLTEINSKLDKERSLTTELQEEKADLINEKEDRDLQLTAEREKIESLERESSELRSSLEKTKTENDEAKSTINVLREQVTINSKLNADLELQLNRSRAHSQTLETECEELKRRCADLEMQVEGHASEMERERDTLRRTMRSVEEVVITKHDQIEELSTAMSKEKIENQRLLAQAEAYRKKINRLEEERFEIRKENENLRSTFSAEMQQLRRERNEMARELEDRLEVVQRASEEVLRNEQEVKEQLQNSYVNKLMKAERKLKEKDLALEEAKTRLRRTQANMASVSSSTDPALKHHRQENDDVLGDLERFELELERDTSVENLNREREVHDEIQNSYIEKMVLTEEILVQKEEVIAAMEGNLKQLQQINRKLVEDNITALEEIKRLKTQQQQQSEEANGRSSTRATFGGQSTSRSNLNDSRRSRSEYERLMEKLSKLEDHLSACAENSGSESVREHHLCRLENLHLSHENASLRHLLSKMKRTKLLDEQDLSLIRQCAAEDEDGSAHEERLERLRSKISSLDRMMSRFELSYHRELEEARSKLHEARKLNDMYEAELRAMARRQKVPVMLLPMYDEDNEDDDDDGQMESTRME